MQRKNKAEGASAARRREDREKSSARDFSSPEALIFLKQKKSLGQNFLHNQHYVRAVADAGNIKPGEVVLEIGPGTGNLTKELLARGAHVVAIEKDHRLLEVLRITFHTEIQNKQIEVIEGDALEAEFNRKDYKVVANIPYYITGALIRKYLTTQNQPTRLVFLVQKEVANRIAKAKKESLLSLSVKAYGTPAYAGTVPRGAFTPAPNVDSAILVVADISRANFTNKEHEARFFELIHAGFAQKRKLLKRNLEGVLGEGSLAALQKAAIAENARAEDVTLAQWLELAKN